MKKFLMTCLTVTILAFSVAPTTAVFASTGAVKTDNKTANVPTSGGTSAVGETVDIVLPTGDATLATKAVNAMGGSKVTFDPKKNGGASGEGSLFTVSGTNIRFNTVSFEKATSESREIEMKKFVSAIQSSGVSDQSQQKIFDELQNANREVNRMLIPMVMDSTSADIYSAMRVVAPFLPFIRLILGVGAILITILLVVSTIIDLVFIGLPVAREAMQGKEGGGGKMSFITQDAQSVVSETESSVGSSGGGGGYKNAYILYFKRRAVTYIVLAFCLLYLVTGELGTLISWLMSLGDGVVSAQ